ncbi:hypothetical protein [Desulfovibrio litoralis]|uniref:Uncharacterized protein n=1 Tax=Desulfovibrio litoralis DSM 11393 TaxID=1121455 RepID=A0A1M7TGQ0_9BACT|nr:hypothetical protein [Desulfovibrio litoralis]SHN69949.1 hypothetical protein SAMN02745728_01980 [Desulfovibrio litoralis DSM 11393]
MGVEPRFLLDRATIILGYGVPLFSCQDALAFIDYLEQNNYGLLGFDGFEISENHIMPRMDYILDCSHSVNEPREIFLSRCFKAARTVLSEPAAQNLFFEFVLEP